MHIVFSFINKETTSRLVIDINNFASDYIDGIRIWVQVYKTPRFKLLTTCQVTCSFSNTLRSRSI